MMKSLTDDQLQQLAELDEEHQPVFPIPFDIGIRGVNISTMARELLDRRRGRDRDARPPAEAPWKRRYAQELHQDEGRLAPGS